LSRYDPTLVNQIITAGGDNGVDVTLLLMTNFVEAISLLLSTAEKIDDLVDEAVKILTMHTIADVDDKSC
jgi:hypothetical protein